MANYLGEMVISIIGDSTQFSHSIDQAQKSFLTMSQIVAQSSSNIAKSFMQIDGEAAVWGKTSDTLRQKQEVLKQEISSLISQGVDPLSTKIEKLQNQYYNLGNEAKKLENKQKTLNERMQSFSQTAGQVGLGLTIGVTAPLALLAKQSIESSANMEMLQTSFQMMLGSADKAQALMAEVIQMAAVTPFETPQLANATKMLLQYNVPLKEVLPLMSRLGDISGGNAERFNRLTYAFSQMNALGRVTGQDLRQMVEAGFNPLSEAAKITGKSMATLQDEMSKGNFTVDLLKQTLVSATSEGGKFYNGMALGAKTYTGLVSTLHDDIGIMERSFSDAFLPTLKGIVDWVGNTALAISKLDPTIKTIILTIAGFAALAGPVLLATAGIANAFLGLSAAALAAGTTIGAILGPVALVIAGLAVLAVGVGVAASEYQKAEQATTDLTDALAYQADLITTTKAFDKAAKDVENLQKKMEEASKVRTEGNARLTAQAEITKKEDEAELKRLIAIREALRQNVFSLERKNKADKDAAAAQAKADKDAEEAKKKKIELTKEQKKAEEDYKNAVGDTNSKIDAGVMTQEDGYKELLSLAMSYSKTLYKNGQMGTQAYRDITTTIKDLKDKIYDLTSDKAYKKYLDDQAKEVADFDQKVLDDERKTTEEKGKIFNSFYENQKTELTKSLERIETERLAFIYAGGSEVEAATWAAEERRKLYDSVTGESTKSLKSILADIEKERLANIAAGMDKVTANSIAADKIVEANKGMFTDLATSEKTYNDARGPLYNEVIEKLDQIDKLRNERILQGVMDIKTANEKAEQEKIDFIEGKEKELPDKLKEINDSVIQLFKDGYLTEKEANELYQKEKLDLYVEEANKILPVVQTTIDDVTKIMNSDSATDMAKGFTDMIANLVGTLGPEGQLAASIIRIAESIINMFSGNETAAKKAAEAMIKSQQDYEKSVLESEANVYEQQISNLKRLTDKKSEELDKQKNAALIAAGLTEDTQQQDLKDAITKINEELKLETDATEIASLKKQKIIDEYEIKKLDLKEKSAAKEAEIEEKLFEVQTKISIAQAKIDRVNALNAYYKLHPEEASYRTPTAGAIAATANYDELIRLLNESLTYKAAKGAIVMPTPGGSIVNVGEGNQPEVIFPLDQLNKFINNNSFTGSTGIDSGNINLIVNLDSEPFLKTIFPATRNRTVKIDSGAIV